MFSRQINLLGKDNQKLIEDSTIGIVGLGGLGSATAHLLVRLGVKNLILIDFDCVEEHNLSRQHLYIQKDIGKTKVKSIKKHLEEINPEVNIKIHKLKIESIANLECLSESDIILDGLDNHAARRLIDLFCKKKGLPWIHGATIQEKGIVFFFDKKTTYNQIYSSKATDTHCDLSGVIATATTAVANIQAQIAINFLLGRTVEKELININMHNISVEKYKKKQ
jgi:adenylyltransferase/sulfurtransferase